MSSAPRNTDARKSRLFLIVFPDALSVSICVTGRAGCHVTEL